MKPLVLKIGGSLAESGRLRSALDLITRARRPIVVVAGGGPFADAVREEQTRLGLSDAAAHRMAILAMNQMANAMADLAPRLVAADTLLAIKRAWRGRRIPIWHPARLCAGDTRIPRDWSITSDGLAARLAERLGGADVALLKSCAIPRGVALEIFAHHGICDPVFPAIVRRAALSWHVLGPGEMATVAGLIDAAETAGKDNGERGYTLGARERRVRFHRLQEDTGLCRVSSKPS